MHAILACMHGAACLELPKLPDDVASQPCMASLDECMRARIMYAHLFYLGIDDFRCRVCFLYHRPTIVSESVLRLQSNSKMHNFVPALYLTSPDYFIVSY